MNPVFQRTAQIIGEDGVELLSRKTAAVFGLGGVGSYAAEALVRAGVGHLIFIDKDSVDISNVNRQLVADVSTLGRLKADVMAERALRVNPDCDVQVLPVYYSTIAPVTGHLLKIFMPISLLMPLMMCLQRFPSSVSATDSISL